MDPRFAIARRALRSIGAFSIILYLLASQSSAATSGELGCWHLNLSNWVSNLELWNGPTLLDQKQLWIIAVSENDTLNEVAFTKLLNDDQQHNSNIKCAILNCGDNPILCHSWLVHPPTLMHIHRDFYPPLRLPTTEWRRIPLEKTTDPVTSIQAIFETSSWADEEVWDGFLHPYTGFLGKHGGGYVWGVIAYYTYFVPSWMFALAATFFVRRLLSKIQPDQPMITAAYRVVPPGSLDK